MRFTLETKRHNSGLILKEELGLSKAPAMIALAKKRRCGLDLEIVRNERGSKVAGRLEYNV
jgi:hypothetical protein